MSSPSSLRSDYRIPVVDFLNTLVSRIAETTAWLNVLLIAIIIVQVVMRYGFNNGQVPLEELMWHFYAIAFMFGMAYAITKDTHIRVDLVHMKLPRRAQHIIEILGILLLLMPFLWIIFHHSIEWVAESYRLDEGSTSPQGLPHRWIIKSVIPLSFALMFVAALARLIEETLLLFHLGKEPQQAFPARVNMLRHLFRVETRTDGEH
ncbi:MAG: TRAP transporter small permease subunit [Thiohalocapsa sp.]